jgi:hypothetical protein
MIARASLAACIVAGLAGSLVSSQAQPPAAPLVSVRSLAFTDIDMGRLRTWLSAAGAHQPGQADEPATAIARWPVNTLAYTVTDVVLLLRMRLSLIAAGGHLPRKYRGRNFCVCTPGAADVIDLNALFGLSPDEKIGPANLILERGALLHTDIAILVPAPPLSRGGAGLQTTLHQADGEVLGAENTEDHWRYARHLLDGIAPDPARGP